MDVSQVKANFLQLERRGWFLSGPPLVELTFPHNRVSPKGYGEAAVLFLINKHLQVLLSKRSTYVSSFKGQACLPGGSQDKSDLSFMQTALREAQEEVNLDPRHVEVVCTLPPLYTSLRTLTVVTPVVAITHRDINELNLVPDPAEVDCLYWVPLEFFLVNAKPMTLKNGFTYFVFNYLDSDTGMNHVIFGVTAQFCMTLSAMALGRLPETPLYKPSMLCEVRGDNENDSITVVFNEVVVLPSQSKL